MLPAPGSRLPAPGSRLPAPGSRLPAPGYYTLLIKRFVKYLSVYKNNLDSKISKIISKSSGRTAFCNKNAPSSIHKATDTVGQRSDWLPTAQNTIAAIVKPWIITIIAYLLKRGIPKSVMQNRSFPAASAQSALEEAKNESTRRYRGFPQIILPMRKNDLLQFGCGESGQTVYFTAQIENSKKTMLYIHGKGGLWNNKHDGYAVRAWTAYKREHISRHKRRANVRMRWA